MARKPRRREPQVPRSTVQESPVTVAESPAKPTLGEARAVPSEPTVAEQYHYVRNDLMRIAVFGTLIFAIMFALKFVVGL